MEGQKKWHAKWFFIIIILQIYHYGKLGKIIGVRLGLKELPEQSVICKMSFEAVYGFIAKDYIHVHHKKPVSEIGEKYEVNPIEDLVPLCPNYMTASSNQLALT
jgi:hypothetical protein